MISTADEVPAVIGDEVEISETVEEMPTADPLQLINTEESELDRTLTEENMEDETDSRPVSDEQSPGEGTNNDAATEETSDNPSEMSTRTHRDVSLLLRHIDHMLRICRAPASDQSLPRPR